MDLHVWAKTLGKDAHVVALISGVVPDGTTRQLSFGSLFTSNRATDTTPCAPRQSYDCSLYVGEQVLRPFHPFTRQARQPVPADTPVELRIEIYPFSDMLLPGHRLRISLLTGDFPAAPPTTSLLTNALGSTVTYLFDRDHPSYLYGARLTTASLQTLLCQPPAA
jgi:predicted acyl esterase